jgi:hypothetical protein
VLSRTSDNTLAISRGRRLSSWTPAIASSVRQTWESAAWPRAPAPLPAKTTFRRGMTINDARSAHQRRRAERREKYASREDIARVERAQAQAERAQKAYEAGTATATESLYAEVAARAIVRELDQTVGNTAADERARARLVRLPQMASMMRFLYSSQRVSVLKYKYVVDRLIHSFKLEGVSQSKEDIGAMLDVLSQDAPEWVDRSRVGWVKLNRSYPWESVVEKLKARAEVEDAVMPEKEEK